MNMAVTERRQIENEMIFRRFNEKVGSDLDEIDAQHIEDGNPHLVRSDDLLLEFKCECSDENCDARLPMRLSVYRQIHEERNSFIIKLNHEVRPIERVVLQGDGYSVVQKNHATREPDDTLNITSIDNSGK